MKRIIFIAFALLSSSTCVYAKAPAPAPCLVISPDNQDGVLVAPLNHHVLFEDEDVRVIEVTQAPHTRETMHTHARPSIFYLDGPTAMRYVVAGDEVHAVERKAPPREMQPLVIPFKPEGLHAVENLSDNIFHALRVELKHPGCDLAPKPLVMPNPKDALVMAPANYKLLFENEEVRVIDVVIPSHDKEPMHTDTWGGFAYFEHAARWQTFDSTGKPEGVREVQSGSKVVAVGPQGSHFIENLGDAPLHEVRFELKHETNR